MKDGASPVVLQDWINGHRDEMVQDLSDYIGQETPSDDKNLLIKGLDWTERWLGLRLGTPAARRLVDGGEHGDTVVLDYPSPALPAAPWATALCHYDTVWEAGTLAEWPVSVGGDSLTVVMARR